MLHVEVSRVTGDPLRLSDAISFLEADASPAVERQHGSMGTSLLADLKAGVLAFESLWASEGALLRAEQVVAAQLREAAQRAGGKVSGERYQVLVFEREAPLRGGQGVRVTPVHVDPSKLSTIEDAVAWYGDTAVPLLADVSGFCAALLYADWSSGNLISETVWRDLPALSATRSTATAGEAAAAEAIDGVIGAPAEYRLFFSSAGRA